MKRACELMKETTLSVADIAEQTGFQTPGYFIKVFKNHFGETPGYYAEYANSKWRFACTKRHYPNRQGEVKSFFRQGCAENDGNSRNFFLFLHVGW